jgi:uncharacterized protein YyaL (SSP411 family)
LRADVRDSVAYTEGVHRTNHLASEKSPYLLQHAHNPVDWYPWGAPAFETARREQKPIFLSIGYSTCHWCHVMERESFESEEIAEVLNRYFVPIKVDREERPDVDRIYMTFVQATTGSGGWPMSVFLTPDLKPFFGGTYFPPDNRYGRPGFKAILEYLAKSWALERDKILQSSAEVIGQLNQAAGAGAGLPHALDAGILDTAYQYFRRTFDRKYGGFGDAPKFPRPVALHFLLRYYARTGNAEALDMTLATLRAMAEGGMHDQLGGGFHRYSVDERWFVPHFEKMLYDQAQLAISYLEAFQISKDEYFADVARDIFDYTLRDMVSPEGGFYSAEDADSAVDAAKPNDKSEGAFYIWSRQEIDAVLGPEASLFASRYGVEASGNVRNDPHNEFTGKNILYVARSSEDNLDQARARLLEERSRRPRPHLDDKILTAWNGLMISAFAKGAQALDEPRYLDAADRAAEFILSRMYDAKTGTLLRRYRDGDAAIAGFLDDYAFFAQALLDLYETDFRFERIEVAMRLADMMIERFEDPVHGAFFSSAEGDESLVLRMKDDYDGAEPSGNSVALAVLLKLAQISDEPRYREAAERTLKGLSGRISGQPVAVPQMLAALDTWLGPRREIVVVGDLNDERTRAFLRELRSRFLPKSIVLLVDSDETRAKLAHFTDMQQIGGTTTAYVCENYACRLPTSDLTKFGELLQ